jgi:hypothetical protein
MGSRAREVLVDTARSAPVLGDGAVLSGFHVARTVQASRTDTLVLGFSRFRGTLRFLKGIAGEVPYLGGAPADFQRLGVQRAL